ncbi:MAG: dihydroorotase [Verrucomicrobiota bacterium]
MSVEPLIIEGGRIVDPSSNRDEVGDLFLRDGVVSTPFARDKARVIDAKGKVVSPGLVDIHVHFREPGQTHKEDVGSGTRAAAAGGFTTVVCMPNTSPPCDNPATIRYINNAIAENAVVKVHTTGCLTKGMEGDSLAPIGSLKKAGVVAVTDDGRCVQNNALMRQVATYSEMFDLPVMDHCQDTSLTEGSVMHEGDWSLRLGLKGWPAAAEDIIVSRNIILSELTRAHIHMQHVSSAGSVSLLRRAKQRGVAVSGEASPHHISLTDKYLGGYDPVFKMNPPLRSEDHRLALIEGLRDGTLDCIATDHAPHRNYEKDVELDSAPFGITGLETSLPVCLETLHRSSGFSLSEVIDLMTRKPAGLLDLQAGTLSEGADADVTIFDSEKEWTPTIDGFQSRSDNSPWLGQTLRGQVETTIVQGRIVYEDGKIL